MVELLDMSISEPQPLLCASLACLLKHSLFWVGPLVQCMLQIGPACMPSRSKKKKMKTQKATSIGLQLSRAGSAKSLATTAFLPTGFAHTGLLCDMQCLWTLSQHRLYSYLSSYRSARAHSCNQMTSAEPSCIHRLACATACSSARQAVVLHVGEACHASTSGLSSITHFLHSTAQHSSFAAETQLHHNVRSQTQLHYLSHTRSKCWGVTHA